MALKQVKLQPTFMQMLVLILGHVSPAIPKMYK